MRSWALAAILAIGSAMVAAAAAPDLLPIARPDLTEMEPQVREQFEQTLRTLDQVLASETISNDELAAVFGSTGQLFMLYDFIDNARDCLLNAIDLAPDQFRWLYYLGVVQEGQGDREQAQATFQRASELVPEDLATRIRLGGVELDLMEPAQAAAIYQRVLEQDPDNAAAHYGLGRIALLREDAAAAVTHFEHVLTQQPQASTAQYQLGLAYRETGEVDKARSHLALQGRTEVEFEDPLMQDLGTLVRGSSLFVVGATRAKAAGSFDEAVSLFRLALEADPENTPARQALASTLIQMGELTAAVEELEQALEREPGSLATHYNLGTVLAQQGQTEQAIEHLRQAIDIDPEFEDGHINLAVLLAQQGDPQGAVQHYARALAVNSDDLEARQQRARLLIHLGRTDEAIEELRRVTLQSPGSVDDHLELARTLATQDRFSEAADSFAKALELSPEDRATGFGLALTLLLAARYPEALAHLESSAKRQPENLEIRHLLARFLATCPAADLRDGVRALRMAQEVMRFQPNFEYAETVAMAFAEVGQYAQAVATQSQIMDRVGPSADPQMATRLARHLDLYLQSRPVRAPWLTGR